MNCAESQYGTCCPRVLVHGQRVPVFVWVHRVSANREFCIESERCGIVEVGHIYT